MFFMSCHQTVEQNHNIKVANKSLKNVAKLKYSIPEEIRSRLTL
jgi:hypothetical protein